MKATQLFLATAALAIVSSAVLAQEAAPLTRVEVKQQVLAARANHTLIHAGEAGPEEMTPYKAQIEAAPTLSRGQEKADVLQARAAHQLAHTGSVAPEEEMLYARSHPSTSTLTRGDVRESVLEARANGTLIPAGEGEFSGGPHPVGHASYALRDRFEQWKAARGQ